MLNLGHQFMHLYSTFQEFFIDLDQKDLNMPLILETIYFGQLNDLKYQQMFNFFVDMHANSLIYDIDNISTNSAKLIFIMLERGFVPNLPPEEVDNWAFLPINAFKKMKRNGWNGIWNNGLNFRHITPTKNIRLALHHKAKPLGLRDTEHTDLYLFENFMQDESTFPAASWTLKFNGKTTISYNLCHYIDFIENKNIPYQQTTNESLSNKNHGTRRLIHHPLILLNYVDNPDDVALIKKISDLISAFGTLGEHVYEKISAKEAIILKNDIHSTQKPPHSL